MCSAIIYASGTTCMLETVIVIRTPVTIHISVPVTISTKFHTRQYPECIMVNGKRNVKIVALNPTSKQGKIDG